MITGLLIFQKQEQILSVLRERFHLSPANSSTGKSTDRSKPTLENSSKLSASQFYVRARISETTSTGVHAIAAGTLVTKTGEEEGKYIVTDGRAVVKTDPANLTPTASEAQ